MDNTLTSVDIEMEQKMDTCTCLCFFGDFLVDVAVAFQQGPARTGCGIVLYRPLR